MNNIITDIKALQEETLLNLQSSKSNNTVRAYKSDFKDFGLFCAQNGFKSLPSEPKIKIWDEFHDGLDQESIESEPIPTNNALP